MANRKVIEDSYVRSLLMRNLCSSSSDEDDLTTLAIVDDCEATRCKNDIARLSSSSDEEKMTVRCRDLSRNNRLSPTSDNSNFRTQPVEQATGQDTSLRRDSNPFSFKAFLKNGTQQTNYHNTGARPKVYSSPTSSPGSVFDKDSASSSGVYSGRNPTELPDFVQDHLVIEQCYLNHETDQPVLPDVDNLPDFALNSMEHRQSRLRNETKKNDPEIFGDDLRSFDLTETLHKGSTHRDHSASNASMHSNHFDLPVFEDRLDENTPYLPRPEHREFPFDLPLPFAESNPNVNAITRDGNLPGSETSVHKSLPDFLSDGPIYNRSADSEPTGASMIESTERRLLLENERLHQQLETARRQISEKTERIRSLEAELLSKREVEHEETAHLEKAMEQVEDNLKRSTKRAVNAESTVTSLKKKIKALTTEISLLRLENDQLRARTSTTGQGESNTGAANTNRTVRRLAHDLFTAASSAEVSLRQLMSGVDNLRVLASTLENMNKIEDWTKDFLPDSDEDNAAGPAV
ncbi:Serologically defined colon cancer antigen 3-like protein [Camponotus floridanus]|uniref:Endosome-associated-trafficking regulator 1 n=2 Tax=Camponotus floridanus TaxID=104421 RepID=E2AVG9_CAMFO|nr:Serologically defined colon cancer antigen 3-like protein [Camponotus floridanus]